MLSAKPKTRRDTREMKDPSPSLVIGEKQHANRSHKLMMEVRYTFAQLTKMNQCPPSIHQPLPDCSFGSPVRKIPLRSRMHLLGRRDSLPPLSLFSPLKLGIENDNTSFSQEHKGEESSGLSCQNVSTTSRSPAISNQDASARKSFRSLGKNLSGTASRSFVHSVSSSRSLPAPRSSRKRFSAAESKVELKSPSEASTDSTGTKSLLLLQMHIRKHSLNPSGFLEKSGSSSRSLPSPRPSRKRLAASTSKCRPRSLGDFTRRTKSSLLSSKLSRKLSHDTASSLQKSGSSSRSLSCPRTTRPCFKRSASESSSHQCLRDASIRYLCSPRKKFSSLSDVVAAYDSIVGSDIEIPFSAATDRLGKGVPPCGGETTK